MKHVTHFTYFQRRDHITICTWSSKPREDLAVYSQSKGGTFIARLL